MENLWNMEMTVIRIEVTVSETVFLKHYQKEKKNWKLEEEPRQ